MPGTGAYILLITLVKFTMFQIYVYKPMNAIMRHQEVRSTLLYNNELEIA